MAEPTRRLWMDDQRTIMVEAYVPHALLIPDELHIATRRDPDAIWGPPTLLWLEPLTGTGQPTTTGGTDAP